jgi:single-strand DNA-binding protein
MGKYPKGGLSLNQVILTGRLAKEPELHYSKDGIGVTSFHLAVKRNYKSSDGTYEADFVPCVSFRRTAENIASYCDKGTLVALSGRLQTRSYENKDNIKIYVTEVVVDSIEFLQRRRSEAKKEKVLA